MKLIIAEKPSQAKEYANALGSFQKKDGYFENSQYYITWCFGHLIELERDTKYREAGNWNKSYLPILPVKFQYKIGSDNKGTEDPGKKKQIKIISFLINKSTEIINGTDADREGELIFRYVYNYLNCKLPFKRLWISSLTEGDIKKGFANLLSANEVDNLAKSAYARAIADWLVGVNGTQASTLQFGSGTLLTIGRVQTAILKIICERYLKNKSFTKTYTYKLVAKHHHLFDFTSETSPYLTKAEADKTLKLLKGEHLCTSVEKKTVNQSAPLLFSIDTLIIDANKNFGYTGQQTLDTAQALYEKKLTSYPRTDNEYINEENYNNLKKIIPVLSQETLKLSFTFSNDKPKSVNNLKLTGSHDAIVPTGEKYNGNLTQIENNIFEIIIRRCLQSFSTPAAYSKAKYFFINNEIVFSTSTSKLLVKGWKSFLLKNEDSDKDAAQDTDLNLIKGSTYKIINVEVKEIESTPPKLYSEVNLTQDLTNIGRLLKEENPDLLKVISESVDINKLQIGTQATRPAIIERLKNLSFIEVLKNKFIPTEKGLKYYTILKDLEISNIVTTAVWEMKLKAVAEGNDDVKGFYADIKTYTTKIVIDIFNKSTDAVFTAKKEVLGMCPKCKKGDVLEGKKGYGCSAWKQGCDFVIWKFVAKKKLSASVIKTLLTKKQSGVIKGFESKAGNKFEASLILNKDLKIEFNFNK